MKDDQSERRRRVFNEGRLQEIFSNAMTKTPVEFMVVDQVEKFPLGIEAW